MIRYFWERPDFLHIDYQGYVTGEALVDNALALAGDARLDDTRLVLGNWLNCTGSNVSEDDVKMLVAVMKSVCRICPSVKNASVVRPDKGGNALIAFYKMLADDLPWHTDIFHSYEEAYCWLGCPELIDANKD